jgi:hypothetical protein
MLWEREAYLVSGEQILIEVSGWGKVSRGCEVYRSSHYRRGWTPHWMSFSSSDGAMVVEGSRGLPGSRSYMMDGQDVALLFSSQFVPSFR